MGAAMRFPALSLGLIALLLLTMVPLASGSVVQPAAATYPPLKANVTGTSVAALGAKYTFTISATGGPAQLQNGTFVGNYTFNASIIGANTTGGSVSPSTGSLRNGETTLNLTAPNNTGSYTLSVTVTSVYGKNNTTISAGAAFLVVIPYVVSASIDNHNYYTVRGALIQVSLDGTQVAVVTLPSIAANGSYSFQYNYTTAGLSSGSHTFTLTLEGAYGLLTFSNGDASVSSTFYVTAPPVDYTYYYLIGASLVVLAIFISLFVVGGPKRKRTK